MPKPRSFADVLMRNVKKAETPSASPEPKYSPVNSEAAPIVSPPPPTTLEVSKEPTRILNLRRRFERIQETKDRLARGVGPRPDGRQVRAMNAEMEILFELEEWERTSRPSRDDTTTSTTLSGSATEVPLQHEWTIWCHGGSRTTSPFTSTPSTPKCAPASDPELTSIEERQEPFDHEHEHDTAAWTHTPYGTMETLEHPFIHASEVPRVPRGSLSSSLSHSSTTGLSDCLSQSQSTTGMRLMIGDQASTPVGTEDGITELGSFSTIQGFWSYANNLKWDQTADGRVISCFKSGIIPSLHDPRNVAGGKWTISSPKEMRGLWWTEILMAMVGEQLDAHSPETVCGVMLSTSKSGDTIQIWVDAGHFGWSYSRAPAVYCDRHRPTMELAIMKILKLSPHTSSGIVFEPNYCTSHYTDNHATAPIPVWHCEDYSHVY